MTLLFSCVLLGFLFGVSSPTQLHCETLDSHSAVCPGQNIRELPNNFNQTIQVLVLPYNKLTKLDVSVLKNYKHIHSLNLNYNDIRSTSRIQAIKVLTTLKVLDIEGNGIIDFDFQTFKFNKNLEEINADNNIHIFIKDACAFMPSLKRISFKRSRISDFPWKVLKCFSNLEYLDLRYNNLNTIPPDMFYFLSPTIKKIYLVGNSLNVGKIDPRILEKSDLKYEETDKNIVNKDYTVENRQVAKNDNKNITSFTNTSTTEGDSNSETYDVKPLLFTMLAIGALITIAGMVALYRKSV